MAEDIYASAFAKAVFNPRGEKVRRSYDWIAPFSKGRYRITKKDGRYGILKLIGLTTAEILEASAICPPRLEDLFHYGITIAQLKTETVLIDSAGRKLQSGLGIWIIDENLVSVEKTEKRYVLYNPQNDRTVGEFSDFEAFEDYIETQVGELKGLLTRDLVEVFKPEFESVEAFGSCFVAIKSDGTKVLGHPNWKHAIEADEIYSERRGFICLHNKTRYAFVETKTGRRTQFIFPYAESFNKDGYAKVEHPLYGLCWMDGNFNFLPAREED